MAAARAHGCRGQVKQIAAITPVSAARLAGSQETRLFT